MTSSSYADGGRRPVVLLSLFALLVALVPGTALALPSAQQAGGAFVDVRTFGATGDGTTDDTAAIEAAFRALEKARGGTVRFPAGVYLYSRGLTISGPAFGDKLSGVIIEGQAGAILRQDPRAGTLTTDVLHIRSAENVTVRDLRFEGPGQAFPSTDEKWVVHFGGDTLNNLAFNLSIEGYDRTGAIDHSGAGLGSISQSYLINVSAGISQTSIAGTAQVSDNYISLWPEDQGQALGAIDCAGACAIRGNYIKGPRIGISVTGRSAEGIGLHTVAGNVVQGTSDQATGVRVLDTVQATVVGNILSRVRTGVAAGASRVSIGDNSIEGRGSDRGSGVQLYWEDQLSGNVTIAGNTFSDLATGITSDGKPATNIQHYANTYDRVARAVDTSGWTGASVRYPDLAAVVESADRTAIRLDTALTDMDEELGQQRVTSAQAGQAAVDARAAVARYQTWLTVLSVLLGLTMLTAAYAVFKARSSV